MALVRYEHTGAAPATGLSVGINSSALSFTALSGTGYPTGAVGKFVIVIDPGTASEEKVLCTARSGATFTIDAAGRGYDNTTAASHSAGTTNIQHVFSAAEADDANSHIYVTTRDDHTQYARTDGTRAFTGGVTISSGGLSVTGGTTLGGTVVLSGATNANSTLAVTGQLTAAGVVSTLTGTNGRYVGATSGAPATGTYSTGDFATDPTNDSIWICTSGGSPGTWVSINPQGAWTTYSPTWASNGGSAPAIGNGTITGSYVQQGKLVTFRAKIVAGSTTTFGTLGLELSLPVASKTPTQNVAGFHFDGTNNYAAMGVISSSNALLFTMKGGAAGAMTTYGPGGSATDAFNIEGSYEAA